MKPFAMFLHVRAHTRAVSRLCNVAMRRLTGQLPASALRRERSHARNELPQKLVGLHEHREVSRARYRDELLVWCTQRGHELVRETCRRGEILRSLYDEDGNRELSAERFRI